MSRAFNPLHMVADSRFFMLITRAINHNRVVPSSADSRMGSARSSWSSASIVSSIDLKSPEPEVYTLFSLEAINSTVRNRKLLISLITLLVLLILIGIVLGVVIPLIFMQNSSITTTVSTVTTTTKV
ncbi:unnamed protein product [Rotaria socialis]|uniref:Uncharacterized protein n=1 Tax=Rotaria socialis TaxID=392032 RepID=A0A820MLM8_9BILA|nr:unnamed protein product [Rotaria socialis]